MACISEIHRYVKNHKTHQLNQAPNYDYLGHPVNAYHLIRHVASGWATVLDEVMNNDTLSLIEDIGIYSSYFLMSPISYKS